MPEFYHGPEIIENFTGGRSVRDVKAATLYLIGTAPVHIVHSVLATRAKYIETDVIIRSKEDAIAAFGPFNAVGGYTIPLALHAIFNKDRGKGVGTIIVRNVFDPVRHLISGVPSPGAVQSADIIGSFTSAGKPLGLEAIAYIYAQFGYQARRIIAPSFSTILSVRQKMLAMAQKVKAIAIADLPMGLTKQGIIAQRGVSQPYQASDDRMVYCAPYVWALDPITGGQSLQPLSQHYAGVWNEVVNREEGDDDGGPAASPSNRPLVDVSSTEIPLSFYPGDYSSDVNALNEIGIVTANMGQFGTGILTWGDLSSSQGSTSQTQVTRDVRIRTMYDVLHDTILFSLMPYVDKRGTLANIEYIEDQIQQYINQKERDGWLYGGRFFFDRAKNTPDEILQGRYYYKLEGAPMGSQRRITVESFIDMSIIKTALSLQ
jgi:uncharacterized protein